MIRGSSYHDIFSLVYNNYKSLLAVETDGIIMSTENRLCFEILTQEFDTMFEYTSQTGLKLKLFNIKIIQSKYDISFDQTDHIMKKLFKNIGKKKKRGKIPKFTITSG